MTMDANAANRLHALLTKQYAAHKELQTSLQMQQQAIRKFDAAGLDQLRQRADTLAERIADLNTARESMTGPNVRLTELADRLPEPQRSRLMAMSVALRSLAKEIASLNRINQAAVRHMLNHFHSVYQMLARGSQPVGYGAGGQASGGGQSFLVDAVA